MHSINYLQPLAMYECLLMLELLGHIIRPDVISML